MGSVAVGLAVFMLGDDFTTDEDDKAWTGRTALSETSEAEVSLQLIGSVIVAIRGMIATIPSVRLIHIVALWIESQSVSGRDHLSN